MFLLYYFNIKRGVNMKEFNNFLTKYKYEIDNINVLSLFSGIGAFEQSLKELGVSYKVSNFAEIDIDAIISYSSIHISNFNEIEFEYQQKEDGGADPCHRISASVLRAVFRVPDRSVGGTLAVGAGHSAAGDGACDHCGLCGKDQRNQKG